MGTIRTLQLSLPVLFNSPLLSFKYYTFNSIEFATSYPYVKQETNRAVHVSQFEISMGSVSIELFAVLMRLYWVNFTYLMNHSSILGCTT